MRIRDHGTPDAMHGNGQRERTGVAPRRNRPVVSFVFAVVRAAAWREIPGFPARARAGRINIRAQRLSNRAFGLAFMAIALAFVGLRWWFTSEVSTVGLAVAAVFALAACFLPTALLPLNRLWMQIAARLGVLTNTVVLAVALYLILTPTSLVMRLFTRDLLNTRLNPDVKSYLQPVTRQTEASTLQDIF